VKSWSAHRSLMLATSALVLWLQTHGMLSWPPSPDDIISTSSNTRCQPPHTSGRKLFHPSPLNEGMPCLASRRCGVRNVVCWLAAQQGRHANSQQHDDNQRD
jgi:hypothetical protein